MRVNFPGCPSFDIVWINLVLGSRKPLAFLQFFRLLFRQEKFQVFHSMPVQNKYFKIKNPKKNSYLFAKKNKSSGDFGQKLFSEEIIHKSSLLYLVYSSFEVCSITRNTLLSSFDFDAESSSENFFFAKYGFWYWFLIFCKIFTRKSTLFLIYNLHKAEYNSAGKSFVRRVWSHDPDLQFCEISDLIPPILYL